MRGTDASWDGCRVFLGPAMLDFVFDSDGRARSSPGWQFARRAGACPTSLSRFCIRMGPSVNCHFVFPARDTYLTVTLDVFSVRPRRLRGLV
jgi:hypothetical protein